MKKIFVSSTFRDMQFERDAIHKEVVPALNSIAYEYGDSLELLDLRWGINTGDLDEESGAKKVLSVCLDAIDRCKPYIIILIGDRYGWVPPASLVEETAKEKGYTPDVMTQSVTELEIEYGALSRAQQAKCLVYFREMPYEHLSEEEKGIYTTASSQDAARLEKLKLKLKNAFGGSIKTYSPEIDPDTGSVVGVKAFTDQLISDMTGLLSSEWSKNQQLTWQQRVENEISLFVSQKQYAFSGRSADISFCMNHVREKDDILVISGEAGIGKSTLMAELCRQFEQDDYTVVPFFCGVSASTYNSLGMLKYLIWKMETLLGNEDHFDATEAGNKQISLKELRDIFTKLCKTFIESRDRKTVFIVDAIDQMYQDETVERLLWTPLIKDSRINIIISCISEQKISALCERKELLPLSDADSRIAVKNLLDMRCKDIDEDVLFHLLHHPCAKNPLYLSMAVTRLLMFDQQDFAAMDARGAGMEGINRYLIEVIDSLPDEIEALCAEVISEAARHVNTDAIKESLNLLAVPRRGLRESDIESLCKARGLEWNTLDFAWLLRYLPNCFRYLDDGRVDFTHKSIRQGFLRRIDDTRKYNALLFEHFQSLHEDDPVRAEEILFYAYASDGKEFFLSYIGKLMSTHEGAFTEDKLRIARREVKEICLSGGNPFIISIMDSIKDTLSDYTFFGFFVFQLYYEFDDTLSQAEVLLEILLKTAQIGDDNMHEFLHDMDPYKAMQVLWVLAFNNFSLGSLLQTKGDFKAAVERFELSVRLAEALNGTALESTAKRLTADATNRIGRIKEYKGEMDGLSEIYDKASAIRKELYDDKKPGQSQIDLLYSESNSAEMLKNEGKLDEAYALLEQTIESAKNILPLSRRVLSMLLDQKGEILEIRDRLDGALEAYQEAYSIDEELVLEEGTPEAQSAFAKTCSYLGYVYALKGEYQRAISYYEKDLSVSNGLNKVMNTPESRREVLISQNNVSEVLELLKESDKAKQLRKSSLDIATELYRADSNPRAKDDFAVALVSYGLHLPEEKAGAYIRHAASIWEELYKNDPQPIYKERILFCKRINRGGII